MNDLYNKLREASVFQPPSEEEAKKRTGITPELQALADKADEFREQHSGNALEEPELSGEAEKISDAHWDDMKSVHAINPKAKFLYFERKYDPKQYANLIDVKGDFIEEIAVAAVEDVELGRAMAANTFEELDNLEKHGATSMLEVIPPGAKWFVIELGLEPVFCATPQAIKDAFGDD